MHIWGFKKTPAYITAETMNLARLYVAGRKEAFSDTLVRALFDDIKRGAGGGTYYLDGRSVRKGDRDSKGYNYYAVGGAMDNSEIRIDASEFKSEEDVRAAIELLREVIVTLQEDSDDPVGIGFWFDGAGLCCFDASNIVVGERSPIALGQHRNEETIYDLTDDKEIYLRDVQAAYVARAKKIETRERDRKRRTGYTSWQAYNIYRTRGKR